VNVPVALVSAARDLDYHFRELHVKDRAPIEQRRVCSKEDVEVSFEEVAHSYDRNGKQVVVSDEELASVQPRKTRTIDIEAFVDLEQIDPLYFDHPYFLVPAGDSEGTRRAYRLLVEVMAGHDRVALGRFVLRTKEYLVAVRVLDDALALTTMRFHDELRPTKGIPAGGRKPTKSALEDAVAIIEELSTEWRPERYEDCYNERLRRVIEAKRKRKRIHVPKPEKEPPPPRDLMEALQESLEQVQSRGRGRAKNGARDGGRSSAGKSTRSAKKSATSNRRGRSRARSGH
jgi:DNA end-binding protein Ku